MKIDQLKETLNNISVWKKGGQRAPHKPLLILYALSQCIQRKNRLIKFSEIDSKLGQLLRDFGPLRKSYHPEYPFWRLQNDGIWEVTNKAVVVLRKGHTDAKKSELINHNVRGGFCAEIYNILIKNPKLITEIASSILEVHFPASIHDDIIQSIGLYIPYSRCEKEKRNPQFREKVLNAYEYRCAVCGYNLRVGNTLIGLEAAHIKWHQAGGPDIENNGIALCALHHKLFDRGAFSLSTGLEIQVSDRAHGAAGFGKWLMDFHGLTIRAPQRPTYFPNPNYIDWHSREVFQGEVRHKQ